MSDAKSPAKKAHPLVAAMVKAAVEWKIKSPKKGVIRICDCQKVPEDIDESELLKHLMTWHTEVLDTDPVSELNPDLEVDMVLEHLEQVGGDESDWGGGSCGYGPQPCDEDGTKWRCTVTSCGRGELSGTFE